jgi:cystathionine beta-lyase/cystathionine gamma-synthase
LRTLHGPACVEHERSALELARRPADHPSVTVIHHPAFRRPPAPEGAKGPSGCFQSSCIRPSISRLL